MKVGLERGVGYGFRSHFGRVLDPCRHIPGGEVGRVRRGP